MSLSMIICNLTFADKQTENGRNLSIYTGLRPYCFVIFSWRFFIFLSLPKFFLFLQGYGYVSQNQYL